MQNLETLLDKLESKEITPDELLLLSNTLEGLSQDAFEDFCRLHTDKSRAERDFCWQTEQDFLQTMLEFLSEMPQDRLEIYLMTLQSNTFEGFSP